MFWWAVTIAGPGGCREIWVKGGSYFGGEALREAESRLEDGEVITSWQRAEAFGWRIAGMRA